MSIEIISVNGKCDFFDYDIFEFSLKQIIGERCTDAKVFILNNFPVPVSIETNIDVVLIIAIEEKSGNFYRPKIVNKRSIYFHNQIIPIKFVTQYKDEECLIDDKNQLLIGDGYFDYTNELNSMKFGLSRYLINKCGFKKQALYVNPIIFIQNKKEIIFDNFIISNNFDFYCLHKLFVNSKKDIFVSYIDWKSNFGYSLISNDIKRILDKASNDSKVGYLTRKKIERISKQLSIDRSIYNELNKNLIIISGKAGTGKSSELLNLTMKCLSNGQNTLYLTYNKLLVFDIAKTVKTYLVSFKNKSSLKPGEGTVLTLHQFFYRLSNTLGVLHVLNADKIQKISDVLKERINRIHEFIQTENFKQNQNWDDLKTKIQNSFDIGTIEVGIDYVNFLAKHSADTIEKIHSLRIDFFNSKIKNLIEINNSDIFLANYYGVLEDILLQIQNPDQYYHKYDIKDKFELFDVAIGISEKYIEVNNDELIITEKGFKEFKNRKIGGQRRKRTLFVDEAQDCHPLEKEILLAIFNSKNIIIANGGKEQLIRHVELCNWEKSYNKAIGFKKHHTRNKSFRVKKTVVDFCNFVANKFNIDLSLESVDSQDEGELIIDFRKDHSEDEIVDLFNQLNLKGEINNCSTYESTLVLLDSNTQRLNLQNHQNSIKNSIVINEYGNIEDVIQLERGNWKHLSVLENNNLMFWDGTKMDKSNLQVPTSNETRLIYYESCRGLEAWSVVCFSFDDFFKNKLNDSDAERFLIDDKEKSNLMQDLFNVSNEDRKKMYAATWILMAMTRTIDTLYIQISDKNSELGKVVTEYLSLKNKNVRHIN